MNSTLVVDHERSGVGRRRYFPGWTMVGVAAAAQFMSAPGQSYSVAAFKEPMQASLGLTETSYSLAYAFATIVSGLLVPRVGRMIDRHGARRMLPAIPILLGFACLGMSRVSSLGSLYLGFSFVRSLGQGALSLAAAWLVSEWFARRRGLAKAISGLGGSLSVMSIPLLNAYVILHFGWLTDRCQARHLLSAAMLLLALAGTTVLLMPFPWIAVLYAVLLGLHGSILRSTGMVVWISYYGLAHQGAIRGIAMAVMIFAAAAGPLPLALSIDWFGSYDLALGAFIAVPLVSALLVWSAGPQPA